MQYGVLSCDKQEEDVRLRLARYLTVTAIPLATKTKQVEGRFTFLLGSKSRRKFTRLLQRFHTPGEREKEMKWLIERIGYNNDPG